ncbi:MAG: methylenetetrahydrofolate reductase C-terminal domain-containing protein [Gammaproteobacteria bacterium]
MLSLRKWSVDHARTLESGYSRFERLLKALHPMFERIGYTRLERPTAAVEHAVKRLLFDCQMCGQCVLGDTGMSCPMNCPKQLRNGPCGGVRPDGGCEVKPEMQCVWVEAWRGAQSMREGARIHLVQLPVDASAMGRSTWLSVARGDEWRVQTGALT